MKEYIKNIIAESLKDEVDVDNNKAKKKNNYKKKNIFKI